MKVLVSLAALALAGCVAMVPAGADTVKPSPGRTLLFADEFDGSALDRTKWSVIGPEFWVNDEQQAYLDRPDVIAVRDGKLVLTPRYAPGVDTHAKRKADFVAGRIVSQGKFDFTYGRAEARIRMPDAVGVWPAFWLLGNGGWPTTGEIDIMEYVGDKSWTGVAIHGPKYSGETPFVDRFYFPAGEDAAGWHVYAAEWSKDQVEFFVDGRLTYRVTRPMIENYGRWALDTPQHLILNFALGGAYPGKVNGIKKPYFGMPSETVDKIKRGELAMEVDWVRVYALK
ncbi:MAG: glycoside hydrolase family 16 protein [Zymomonas sp.]|nr:MAG: glycoside hydrolase family 16 protein [Zymomonas sp.]